MTTVNVTTKAKLYICDAMETGKAFETHDVMIDPTDASQMLAVVKSVLGQWMEKGDRISRLESGSGKNGTICPYVIYTENGEHSDIFAQLVF